MESVCPGAGPATAWTVNVCPTPRGPLEERAVATHAPNLGITRPLVPLPGFSA